MRPSARSAARLVAVGLAGHAVANARLLRRPPEASPEILSGERISVLLPLRDEAHRLMPCLRALTSQVGLDEAESVEFVALDDDSSDDTPDLVAAVCSHEPRMRLIRSKGSPPPGFVGKSWACAQLAAAADPKATVLVLLDADVVLAPEALTRAVTLMRDAGLDFVSPYPRQRALSPSERLIQPLLQWSWLTFAPLRLAERSPRRSLAMANGQFLAVDAARYVAAGGHAATGVRDAVIEDLALARALRATGATGGMADGTLLATCRMYDGWEQLRDGYTKSLWAAGGGNPVASLGQLAALSWLYLRPDPVTYAAGVATRIIAARQTGSRVLPDALAHPVSIATLVALTGRSWQHRIAGRLVWKGRPVVTPRCDDQPAVPVASAAPLIA